MSQPQQKTQNRPNVPTGGAKSEGKPETPVATPPAEQVPPVAGGSERKVTQDKEVPPVTPDTPPVQANRGANADAPLMGLIEYLKGTGAPHYAITPLEALYHENPAATAENGLRLLIQLEKQNRVNIGTVSRSGKWVHGPQWAPERAYHEAPDEEIKNLRTQVEQLTQRLRNEQAEKRALTARLQYVQEQYDNLRGERAMLERLGKEAKVDITPFDPNPRKFVQETQGATT